MLKELYTAAAGMMPQQTRLEVISNNLANANTIGFKRSNIFERNLIDARSNFYNVPTNLEQNDPPVGAYIDYSKGSYRKTSNKLDISIDNKDAFFVIEDDNYEQFYTRAGNFMIDEKGYITNQEGLKLVGSNGYINVMKHFLVDRNNVVDKESLNIRINQFGEIFLNEEQIDSIKLAKIENPQTLFKMSGSKFIPTVDTIINNVEPDKVNIKQGWLEDSNVNIIDEMVEMIQLQRLFETGSKVIAANNETLDKSIQMSSFY